MTRLVAAALVLAGACAGPGSAPAVPPATLPPGMPASVVRVVDGDTLIVVPDQRVRLLGIDAPEIPAVGEVGECYGAEAKAELERVVGGQTVVLVAEGPDRDSYGRLLRFVFTDDGRNVSAHLLRGGFAVEFRKAGIMGFAFLEAEARMARRGLWGACPEHEENGGSTPN